MRGTYQKRHDREILDKKGSFREQSWAQHIYLGDHWYRIDVFV